MPERLIREGYNGQPFSRFDSLDPTTGGSTSRSSLSTEWRDLGDDRATRLSAYAIDYRLSLFSNFTYALDGQFSQQDKRQVYGVAASHAVDHALGSLPARSEVGVQLRHDRARVGLFETDQRLVTATTRDDKVRETMLGVYGQTKAAGDLAVATVFKHYVLRTSWVIGEGHNFVRTMAKLAADGVDPAVVDEVLQDTFVAVWKGAGRYQGTGDAGAWIWGIAIRRLVDAFRRQPPASYPLDALER